MKEHAVIWFLLAAFCVLLGAAGWVRFAPTDVARWHKPLDLPTAEKKRNAAIRIVKGDGVLLAQLDAIIRQTPRTRVLAGTLADGMITYVTRSAVFSFPDYTTVHLRKDRLEIYGRARFGRSDFGVNATRVDGWLRSLAKGG